MQSRFRVREIRVSTAVLYYINVPRRFSFGCSSGMRIYTFIVIVTTVRVTTISLRSYSREGEVFNDALKSTRREWLIVHAGYVAYSPGTCLEYACYNTTNTSVFRYCKKVGHDGRGRRRGKEAERRGVRGGLL